VVTYGDNFGEAKKRALQIADRKKMMYVNGWVARFFSFKLSNAFLIDWEQGCQMVRF
jgi:hypothetical protein